MILDNGLLRHASAKWWDIGGWPVGSTYAVYVAKGAVSLAASYVNLVTPGTNDLTVGIAPTLAAGGWTFNGTSQYLIAPQVPTASYSMMVQFANYASGEGLHALCGYYAAPRFYVMPNRNTAARYAFGDSTRDVSPNMTAGNLALTGNIGYRNGTLDQSAFGTWSGTAGTMGVGCGLSSGTPSVYSSVVIIALIVCDAVLTAPMVSAKATAMAAL